MRRPTARIALAACTMAVATICQTGCASKRVTPDWVYFPPPPATPHVIHLKSFNSLGELVPRRGTFLELFRGGPVSPFVEKPAGVDYQDGHLYVCDTGLNVVHDWDLTTGTSRRIGDRGEVVLQKPVDVAVNKNGMLFVADTKRQKIFVFGADARLVETLHPDGKDSFVPTAVLAMDDKQGEYSCLATDVASDEVFLFVSKDSWLFKRGGNPIFDTAPEKVRPYFPSGIAAFADKNNPHGAGFVSDMLNSRIIRIDDSDEEMSTFGQPGDRYGDLGQPKHLDVGPDGVIFVADAAFRCVHLFNQEGQLLMLLGGPEDKPGGTPMPLGVAVAESLPENLTRLVPPDFDAHYFLFVTNTIGSKRISLFVVGLPK